TPLAPVTGAGRPNYCYGYAAQAVEVEVNLLTGQVRVLRVISVHDVGRAINMQQVEGQIEGCLAQALGYALLEDLQVRDGRILTPYLSTYLLPTALDMPEIVPIVLELADPNGPYGARGVAEMPLVPFTPAVAAAIHDATGVWLTRQPFTPERVLDALTRGGRLGAAGRAPGRRGVREPHQPPGAGVPAALSGRVQRDGDLLPLRRHALRQQDGPTGRQPLPDHRRGARALQGAWPAG